MVKLLTAWCKAALTALLVLTPIALQAQGILRGHDLRVITSDDGAASRQIVQALQLRYPALQVSSDVRALAARRGPAVYLAVGPAALRASLSVALDAPIVSLFTSSQSFADFAGSERAKGVPVTAIYAEASPVDQLQLISRLFGRRVTVGVLISDRTTYLEPLIRQGARSANLEVDIERVAADESAVRALTKVSGAAALLAVPDSSLYTPSNLRNILESTYRRNQPVVGFSTALVNAGTMATAYSTIDDVLPQLDDVIESITAGRLPVPQFPRYWRVVVNESVARSLNIIVNEEVRTLGTRPQERSR